MNTKLLFGGTFTLLLIFVMVRFLLLNNMESFESNPTISFYYLDKRPWCIKFKPVWEKFEQAVTKK
jgi:hypothetical protein